jgi:hypothetical protein
VWSAGLGMGMLARDPVGIEHVGLVTFAAGGEQRRFGAARESCISLAVGRRDGDGFRASRSVVMRPCGGRDGLGVSPPIVLGAVLVLAMRKGFAMDWNWRWRWVGRY